MNTILNTQKKVVIINELGLHARPAATIAKMVQKADGTIWLLDGENRADASSVIDLLTFNAGKGSHLTLEIESENDFDILNALVDFFEAGFGENEDG